MGNSGIRRQGRMLKKRQEAAAKQERLERAHGDKLVTLLEAAAVLKLSTTQVRRLAQQGKLRSIKADMPDRSQMTTFIFQQSLNAYQELKEVTGRDVTRPKWYMVKLTPEQALAIAQQYAVEIKPRYSTPARNKARVKAAREEATKRYEPHGEFPAHVEFDQKKAQELHVEFENRKQRERT